MSQQPEALKHAEWLERSLTIGAPEAAAELRRLHALKVRHIDLIDGLVAQRDTLRAQVERLQAACHSQNAESYPQAGLSLTGATQEAADTGADDREAFEDWAIEQPRVASEEDCFARSPYGARPYEYGTVQSLWLAWQARAALAASTGANVDAGMVMLIARQLGEWHEDDGPAMWWAWNGHGWAGEPAWCGQPTDSDWPGYHTHWTPHPPMPGGIQASGRVGK